MTLIDPLAVQRAAAVRARAGRLRRGALELRSSPALELHRRALGDVWQGPVATRCLADLLVVARRLDGAADALFVLATRLDRLADQMERPPVTGR